MYFSFKLKGAVTFEGDESQRFLIVICELQLVIQLLRKVNE